MASLDNLEIEPAKGIPDMLAERLASTLPKGFLFKVYHLSTPPTKTEALFSAPPDGRPEKTFCESHFVTISIASKTSTATDVLVFAIEVLIYYTAYSTTFFVSKADSTGYLHLSGLPKPCESPIRTVSTTVLSYLVEQRQRPGVRSIISLFARAQDQYLFPGSVENSGKHVLDDRGLVRWWCKTLNPLVESHGSSKESSFWESVKGFLVIPGLDKYETISYLPRRSASLSEERKLWSIGHPLVEISRYPDAPPRCLVPHFPDDPKARYLDELDDELSKSKDRSTSGQWKSVRNLEQFWEMMAYRQECSAGRMVGFIWVVFTPSNLTLPEALPADSQQSMGSNMNDDSTATSAEESSKRFPRANPTTSKKKKKLTGPIIVRKPRIKTTSRKPAFSQPEKTAYYIWPQHGRGQVVVEERDYKRATELLLRLDFADLDLARNSSRRWIDEVRAGAWREARDAWGRDIVGAKELVSNSAPAGSSAAAEGMTTTSTSTSVSTGGVNNLMGLVRKKRKTVADEAAAGNEPQTTPSQEPAAVPDAPVVNVLSAGMVRKKQKN